MKKWKVLVFILFFCFFAGIVCIAQEGEEDLLFNDGKGWGPPSVKIKIKLYTDKPVYKIGEQAKIAVVADQDCYFTLYAITADKKKYIVVPSKFSSYNKLKANQVFYVRDNQGNFLEQKGPPGKETLQAVVSMEPIDLNNHSKSLDLDQPVVEVIDDKTFIQEVSEELQNRVAHEEKAWGPSHGTKPTGGYTKPTGGYTKPTGGYTKPTGGYTKPTGSATGPRPVYGMAVVTYLVKQ